MLSPRSFQKALNSKGCMQDSRGRGLSRETTWTKEELVDMAHKHFGVLVNYASSMSKQDLCMALKDGRFPKEAFGVRKTAVARSRSKTPPAKRGKSPVAKPLQRNMDKKAAVRMQSPSRKSLSPSRVLNMSPKRSTSPSKFNTRGCVGKATTKNGNWTKDELVEMMVKRFNIKKSDAAKYPKDKLCELLALPTRPLFTSRSKSPEKYAPLHARGDKESLGEEKFSPAESSVFDPFYTSLKSDSVPELYRSREDLIQFSPK